MNEEGEFLCPLILPTRHSNSLGFRQQGNVRYEGGKPVAVRNLIPNGWGFQEMKATYGDGAGMGTRPSPTAPQVTPRASIGFYGEAHVWTKEHIFAQTWVSTIFQPRKAGRMDLGRTSDPKANRNRNAKPDHTRPKERGRVADTIRRRGNHPKARVKVAGVFSLPR